jgi:putative addiction module component (TIGR02574 family)
MSTAVWESVDRLTVAERIQLLDHLWASIAREIESEPVPAALLQELDRRDAAYEANPASAVTLEQLENSLFRKG